ncbi:MAG: hypothetical protein FRX48_07257 [Lasallia pustulata]|uniref:Uncharacterized protein n=1 Tax=Lasallia pustulata TaxID=136370 RepID=A0A5M8PIP3_9LECA|nr:MAG: hypothetical protein FRX48_07257 [Lasallia pustulata]
MFFKAQWLALILALSATASAAPNPDVVTVTVTSTSTEKVAYGYQGASHTKTGTATITAHPAKSTSLPAGCPLWVKMLVAPDIQEKVCHKLPKVSITSHSKVQHSTSSASSTASLSASSATTTSRKKHPKPTGLRAGCPEWVEDYVAAVNLDAACKLVMKEEHLTNSSSTSSSMTTSASKY